MLCINRSGVNPVDLYTTNTPINALNSINSFLNLINILHHDVFPYQNVNILISLDIIGSLCAYANIPLIKYNVNIELCLKGFIIKLFNL